MKIKLSTLSYALILAIIAQPSSSLYAQQSMGYNSWSDFASDQSARQMDRYWERERQQEQFNSRFSQSVGELPTSGRGRHSLAALAIVLGIGIGYIADGAIGGYRALGPSVLCVYVGGCGYSYASKYRGNKLSVYSKEKSILLGPITVLNLEITTDENTYYFKMPNGNLDSQQVDVFRIGLNISPAIFSESTDDESNEFSFIKSLKGGYMTGGWYIGTTMGSEITTIGFNYLKTRSDGSVNYLTSFPDWGSFNKKKIEGGLGHIFGDEDKKVVTNLTLHKESITSEISNGRRTSVTDLRDVGAKVSVKPYLTHNFYLESLLGLGRTSGTWGGGLPNAESFPVKQNYSELGASIGLSTRVLDTALGYVKASQQRLMEWRTTLNHRGKGWGIAAGFTLGYVLRDGIAPLQRMRGNKHWIMPSFWLGMGFM